MCLSSIGDEGVHNGGGGVRPLPMWDLQRV